MEGGFTGGAANQWVAWKDATYTGQVHLAGTDRFAQGSASQKLHLPQPPAGYSDEEAGLYQQIWVVPGGTYTATVKIYLVPPPGAAYNGEDLVAWIGLDPFGQPSGTSGGMTWSVNAATPNTWITATTTVQAVLPVMTLALKGTRKWPQHGNSAYVWFDAVTLSGPVPTGTPPGPDPLPPDPESLIPATIGPNLITNPSFEQAFTNGVSAGWNKWWTAGTGTWKRSERMGKVGPGRYDCGDVNEVSYMNPKSVLLFGGNPETNPNSLGVMGDANLLAQQAKFADTIFVGRPFIDENGYNYFNTQTPTYWGRRFADQCKHLESLVPRIDCWQGLNEPDWSGQWQKVLEFEYAFAQRCHELGLKSCSLSLSTGSPGNIWRMVDETFDPSARDLLEIADYLSHHVYGGPNDEMMVANQNRDDACSFALRPRRFKDMYDRRGWRFPPVIATEGSTYGGWIDRFSPDQIANDLVLMGQYMNADRWWCGYNNFAVGIQCNSAWRPWDLIGKRVANGQLMTEVVGQWNADHPADALDGLYSQMFGAGKVHPKTPAELTPAGLFNGGVNQLVSGLTAGREHLLIAWMKYEFRGHQPTQLAFHLGVDPTGQTTNGNAATIDWGTDRIADQAPVHEIFSHVWRTFVPSGTSASIWLRASHPTADPSIMVYVEQVEVKQLVPPPGPAIELSTAAIDVESAPGVNPAEVTFTIRNAGADSLTYIISDDAAWLSVAPDSGSSAGEEDTVTVSIDVAGLPAGTHNAAITVESAEATNSPQTIAVSLTLAVPVIPADFDHDGDVDQSDFGVFQGCLTGPGIGQSDPACAGARLDADEDVDQSDVAIFLECMSGPNQAGDPSCAE
jgi:hypothetical protein